MQVGQRSIPDERRATITGRYFFRNTHAAAAKMAKKRQAVSTTSAVLIPGSGGAVELAAAVGVGRGAADGASVARPGVGEEENEQ